MEQTTPLERAARALHADYIAEKQRHGIKLADLPAWDDLGDDGRYYFESKARVVLQAIREPSRNMVDAARDVGPAAPYGLGETREKWRTFIDAALSEWELYT